MILRSKDQYHNSRIDLLAQSLIEATNTTANDYLFIDPYSIGDVYHTLALLGAFREAHGKPGQRIHLICNTRCVQVPKFFNNIETWLGMECGPYEFPFEAFAERYVLAPGLPYLLQPDMHARGWLARLIHAGKINIVDAKRVMLDLDFAAPLATPMWDKSARQQAYQKAHSQGLRKHSVIIFNHAQTANPIDPEIFRVLQSRFGDNVFYDTQKDGKGGIPWARPLQIELADVPYFVEFAGNAVAVRSGIVDLLSSVKCNLVTIYPVAWMKNFSLETLGLRKGQPEHAIFLSGNESTAEITSRLQAIVESLPTGDSAAELEPALAPRG